MGAEVLLPHGSEMLTGKVGEQKQSNDDALEGTSHKTTMFNSQAYIVESPNGTEAEYTANIIAENIYISSAHLMNSNSSYFNHYVIKRRTTWQLLKKMPM